MNHPLPSSAGSSNQSGGQLALILMSSGWGPLSQQQSQGSAACAVLGRPWDTSGLAPDGVCALGSQLPQLSKNLYKTLQKSFSFVVSSFSV